MFPLIACSTYLPSAPPMRFSALSGDTPYVFYEPLHVIAKDLDRWYML